MRIPRFRIRTLIIVAAVVALMLAVGVQLPSASRNVLSFLILILGISIGLARLTLYLVSLCGPFTRDGMPSASESRLLGGPAAWVFLSVVYLVGLFVLLTLHSFINM